MRNMGDLGLREAEATHVRLAEQLFRSEKEMPEFQFTPATVTVKELQEFAETTCSVDPRTNGLAELRYVLADVGDHGAVGSRQVGGKGSSVERRDCGAPRVWT